MRPTLNQRVTDLIVAAVNMNTVLVTLLIVLAMCQAGAKPVVTTTTTDDGDNVQMTTSFQSQAQPPPQWDLAVAHGDNISLITFDKSNPNGSPPIQEILIPFPVTSAAATLYQNAKGAPTSPAGGAFISPTTTTATPTSPKLPFGQIEYITTDSSRQLLFYTYLYAQPASYKQRAVRYRDLNAYSLRTKESMRLVHAINNNATFDDLSYSDNDNSLYWIDAKVNYIMQLRLNPSSVTPGPVGEPIPRINLSHVPGRHVTFDGLAMDPRTGYTYYGAWGSPSFGKSAIYYFDGKSSHLLLSENIHSPTSLTVTPDSHLYWVNKPVGSQYAIERVKLTAGDDATIKASREQVHSGQRQHWFDFTIACTKLGSNLFYTDITSRSLYQVDTSTGEQILLKKYYPNVPQGMTASHPAWTSEDNPLCSARASTSTASATTANVPSISTSSSTSTSTEISTIANANTNGPIQSASNQFVFYSCSPVEQFANPCFNGGSCISTDSDSDVRTHCLCTPEWTGPTCEIGTLNSDIQSQEVSLNTFSGLGNGIRNGDSGETLYLAVIIVLAILVTILLLSVGILGIRVCRLTRKPTIRRRIILSRNNHWADANGHGQGGDLAVCELIDIENCCNMNVCDTPCYETGIMKSGDKTVMDSMSSDLDIASSGSGDDKQQLIT